MFLTHFSQISQLLTRFFNDALSFLQGLVLIVFTIAFIYYKLRQGIGDAQSAHMYATKSKQTLTCLVAIFLAKPIINLLAAYFNR